MFTKRDVGAEGLYFRPSRYILDQNARIANGTVNGTAINLHFLGIGNGLTVSKRLHVLMRIIGPADNCFRHRTLSASTQAISATLARTRALAFIVRFG